MPETIEARRLGRFSNSTALDSSVLTTLFVEAMADWPIERLDVRVRYSRSADFSGSLFYQTERLFVNLGRHLAYPYSMETYIARTVSARRSWWKPLYTIALADGYQVVLFIFLHECYHWLIKRAGRNVRQKESMCDRFAARWLVEHFGATIADPKGGFVPREAWDFQDLDRFIATSKGRSHPKRRNHIDMVDSARLVPPGFQYDLFSIS